MAYAKDLTGGRYGNLTVIEKKGLSARRYTSWLCKCDCGNTVTVDSDLLRLGKVTSCGCHGKRASSDICKYNNGVLCEERNCEDCGWNPQIEKRRKGRL